MSIFNGYRQAQEAQAAAYRAQQAYKTQQEHVVIGIDLASPGGDKSVLTARRGNEVQHLELTPDIQRIWVDGRQVYP